MEQTNIPPVTKKKSVLRDLVEALVIAALIAFPIKYFLASPFVVDGTSMYPTFKNKDYLIIDKVSYRFEDIKRGDVIVFNPPFSSSVYFIKRVIALPGETINVKDNTVTIFNTAHPEGFTINEPYISSLRDGETHTTLKDDEYFVMGDNRSVSSDSRVWGILPKANISGRVVLRLYPFTSINVWPGFYNSY